MKAPGTAYDDPVLGKDPQPAHWDDYVRTFEDNGGVHINSGIPNKAFYLLSTKLGGQLLACAGPHLVSRPAQPRAHDHRDVPAVRPLHAPRRARALRQRLGGGEGDARGLERGGREVGVRIELRVEGGFAGIRRPPLVLETGELEPDVARAVESWPRRSRRAARRPAVPT